MKFKEKLHWRLTNLVETIDWNYFKSIPENGFPQRKPAPIRPKEDLPAARGKYVNNYHFALKNYQLQSKIPQFRPGLIADRGCRRHDCREVFEENRPWMRRIY